MTDGEREPIAFDCAVAKVQTLADGAVRVYLDLPESDLLAASQLMACLTHGVYLRAELTPIRGSDEEPVSEQPRKLHI